MRQRVVVSDLDRNLLRELPVEPKEQFFVWLVPAAQRDDDHFFAGQPVHDLRDKIKPLLRRESGNDSDHGQLRISLGHSEGGQQILFALCFAAQVRR